MAQRKRPAKNWGASVKLTSDVADKKLKCLLWGPPGTGKTNFIGTAPKPFVIAAEDGVLTLHKFDIPYFKLDDTMAIYEQTLRIIESAVKREVVLDSEGNTIVDFNEIETICIDSIWMLNSRLTHEIKDEKDIEKFKFDHWGLLLDRIQKIVLDLLESDYHVICTMGEAVKSDAMDEKVKLVTFNMQGSFRDQIAYLFDLNLYMQKESLGKRETFKLFTSDENNHSAKSRVALPKVISDPSFDKIYQPLQDALSKKDN